MGLSGRRAGREANAKIGGGGSQQGSRGGTPSLPDVDVEEDQDGGEGKGSGGVRKKLLKKGLKEKVKKGGGVLKSLSTTGKGGATIAGGSSPVREGKREREDGGEEGEEDEGHFKKRQKLQRVGSTNSLVSQSTGAPDMERSESQDGSLLEASFADD